MSLLINKGEFVSVVGASGSGKSTFLHLLGGLDRPTEGKVIIDGESVYDYEENIALPALLDNNKVDKDYLEEIIKLLGLEERKHYLPSELSGGQQQRVSIGRALFNKPSIVLADEPTGNLDSKNSRDVIELLKYSAKKFNQTLVLITHDMNLALMADRVITIKDGKINLDKYLINK